MAIVDVKLVSGFSVNENVLKEKLKRSETLVEFSAVSRESEALLKRYEIEEQNVILYFDEIKKMSFSLDIIQTTLVKKTKPGVVRVYDYYDPARSVRNKTADILDYICECKLDVVGITESWLCSDDAAVRTELCPDRYKFLDHPRDGLRGSGTGLIYRDSLCAKKLDAGIKHRFISVHASVICDLLPAKPVMSIKRVSYRKLKCVNMTCLNQDLAATALCATCRGEPTNLLPDDVDALARHYNETLSSLTNCHAPLKTKSFKVKRNRVTYLMNEARRTFCTNFIKENSDNQGKLFRAANKLFVAKDELCFPNYHNNTALATDIGEFFVRKISRIRSDIAAMVIDFSVSDLVPDDRVVNKDIALNSFRCLTENEVQDLIQASTKKSCALDPMSTSLVIRLTPLRPVITHIINSLLLTGHFPDKWKEALVKPLIKKKGLDASFTNLQPISNLYYVSKLTERAVYDQTYHHNMTHELFPLLQSAYRKGHSTETALLRVQNDILMNMDRQQVTLLVLLDLSAAFDTVDHGILLHRMETSFGITGTVLEWFRSYLTNRSQRVVFGP
ncbi:RNA-directed DNA polymerase from transposon X-element, partial [Paramuricea clavata]